MQVDLSQLKPNMGESWDEEWRRILPVYYWHVHAHYVTVEQYLHGTVLDAGCGPGFLAARTFPNIGYYTGMDISAKALETARVLFPGATFIQHDCANQPWPFPDRQFGTVVCSEIIEHLESYELVLTEARRVSKQYLVFSVPISMGGVGHVRPTWTYQDVVDVFTPACSRILEIREMREGNFWLVWGAR